MIQRITQAIKQASVRTGVDFSYLLNKASQESGFDPNAKASSSSATGLFQFTSQTWLQMIKNHGSQFGLAQYADHITTDNNGVAHVSDPRWRQAILSLRKDPSVSAEMAGELDQQNFTTLKSGVGGKIGPTELYLAHFLGAGGASDFINKMRSTPNASAANVVPDAAASNPSVFFDKSGAPRSLTQIYQQFAQKFNHTPVIPDSAPAAMMAGNLQPPSAASFSNATSTPSSAYTPPVMSAMNKPTGSSLYAAMVLAQMNMHAADLSALGFGGGTDHKKNPALPALGAMA